MENSEKKTTGTRVSFAAIDKVEERLIVSPVEKKVMGRGWVSWGDGNKYPHYIADLVKNTPTLRTVIAGATDYTVGDDVTADRAEMNRGGETPREIVRKCARNIWTFGGAYALITLSRDLTRVAEVEVLPTECIRANEDGNVFWYSEDWRKGQLKAVMYPKWQYGTREPQSILPIRLWGDGAYPEPVYAASVKACETERQIDIYHLSNITRGFMGSYIVNFNNGVPEDEEKAEIERNWDEKFNGAANGGRVVFCFNPNREAQVTLQKMEVSDYGEKYKTLAEHCRLQIYTAFRANPNLYGVPTTDGKGFSNEEYEATFRLYNRTQIRPVQRAITEAFDKIGIRLSITPFTLDGGDITVTE